MCKIITLTNTSKIKDLEKFVNTARPLITATERDGFGWAALGLNGVFGERTTNIKAQCRINKLNNVVDIPIYKKTFDSFGKVSKQIGPMLIHGRISTNDGTLKNTHPLQKHDWTLIHNGVVTNHGPEYKMNTTNDTEHVLEYIATKGIHTLAANLTGYYAFTAIDNLNRLHVCRDSIATLFVAHIEFIDSYIFATTETLIKELCNKMKWKYSIIEEVQDNIYMIFEGNKLIHQESFHSRGYMKREQEFMSKSVGYLDLDSMDDSRVIGQLDAMNEKDDNEIIEKHWDFFSEIPHMDDSYEVWNRSDDQISVKEFFALDKIKQLECYVVRPDGTVMTVDGTEQLAYM